VNQPPIRVVVSSRAPALRAGLRELLAQAGFEVVHAVDAEQLLEEDLDAVDALVIDAGADRELQAMLSSDLGEMPAVVLGEPGRGAASALAARGWLPSDAGEEIIAAAVSAVAAGLTVFGPDFAPDREALAVSEFDGEIASITEREHDVLELLAAGLPNKAIARRLEISEHTVKFHVGSLLSKLEAQSRTEAVTIAARQGLLTL